MLSYPNSASGTPVEANITPRVFICLLGEEGAQSGCLHSKGLTVKSNKNQHSQI